MGNGNAYLAECCEDRREGAFRIGDLIVLDISVAVGCHELSAERRVQGNEKLRTKEVNYLMHLYYMVQNEISTFFASCVET